MSDESKRSQFNRWWSQFGRDTMEPSHAAWIGWLERDRMAEVAAAPEVRAQDGLWAKDDPRHAFVMGAKWWHCKASGATAFASEVDEMEREANRRYKLPEAPEPNLAKDAEEWGNALNEASWEFLESYSRKLGPPPAALFNSSKTMVRDAILKYVRLHMNSG